MKIIFAVLALSLIGCSRSGSKDGNDAKDQRSKAPLIAAADLSALDPALRQRILEYKAAADKNPTSGEAWGKLGQAYQAADFLPMALICYREANRLDPASGKWLYLLSLLELQNEPEQGLINLARAMALLPSTNDAPRLQLGKALAERGRASEAAAEFIRILAMAPQHAGARLELARLQFRSNNLPSTLELLRPCLTNPFTAKPSLLLVSQAKSRLGESEDAAAIAQRAGSMPKPFDWPDPYLREVQSLQSDEPTLLDRANSFLMQARFADAEKLLAQLQARTPDNPETILLLGRLRLQQRKCDEAEVFFSRHLRLRTNSLHGWVQYGLAHFCQSKWDQAADSFQKAIELKPDFAQAHYNLGLALTRSRKSQQAIAAYQNSLRAQPGDAAAHAALAEEFLQIGKLPEASEQAEEALRIDSKQPKALRVKQMLEQRAR